MRLAPATRLGPYSIDELLGSGGMGEVYRARDTRLGRSVAIKVLPADLARDESGLGRLLREARAASQLAHPNILAIHDFGEHEGTPFIVSELLEGETLRQLLQRGPLPPRRAVDLARQVADGLAAAHAKGIVHRDLKPENIFVTREGRAKILDFGLARLMARPGDEDGEGMQGSTVEGATRPGTVLGTYGYMSPEQARGEPADARSDVFALGAVFHEMLAGTKAFARDTPAETLAAVLREEPPDLSELDARVPADLARIVARCLAKDRDARFQAARDLAFALEDQSAGSSRSGVSAARSTWRRGRVAAAIIAGLATTAVVVGFAAGRRGAPASPEFELVTHHAGAIGLPRFARAGRAVVFAASFGNGPRDVHVVSLDDGGMRSLGVGDAEVWGVSRNDELVVGLPIGEWRSLARMPLTGGAPREISANCIAADWMPSGEELAAIKWPPSVQVPLGTEIYATSNDWLHHLRVHPDGRRACFVAHVGARGTYAIMLADVGSAHRPVAESPHLIGGVAWSRDGAEILASIQHPFETVLVAYSLTGKERVLWRMPGRFVLEDVATDGRLLLNHVHDRFGIRVIEGAGSAREVSSHGRSHLVEVSPDGQHVLLFADHPARVMVGRADGSGARDLGPGWPLCFSPDGTRVLVAPESGGDLSITTLEGVNVETISPMVSGNAWGPAIHAWLPGDILVALDGIEGLILRPLRGGATRPLSAERVAGIPASSPDGREIVVARDGGLRIYPLDGSPPRVVNGSLDGDKAIRWLSDGSILVEERRETIRLMRIDLATGTRSPWQDLGPWRYGTMRTRASGASLDGRVIAQSYEASSDELYIVSGLH